jgi:hypothetical protein
MPKLHLGLTRAKLDELELELNILEHHPYCPVKKPQNLCDCGLSEGRRRLFNYIQSMRNLVEHHAKSN